MRRKPAFRDRKKKKKGYGEILNKFSAPACLLFGPGWVEECPQQSHVHRGLENEVLTANGAQVGREHRDPGRGPCEGGTGRL